MRVYLDNAATTAMLPEVIASMTEAMQTLHGNPSSIHGDGRKVRAAIEDARKRVAKCIGASIGEIFFTSGGTESNNMAIKNAVRDLGVRRIITSPTEHHCGLHSVEYVEHHKGVEVVFVEIDQKGRINQAHLEELLKNEERKTLVSLMHANNEIGTLTNIQAVGELCHTYGAYFHTDTVQTIGHFPINVNDVKVHFLSGGAHKFHGPKGCGFIYINGEAKLKPYIDGGSQERNMRGGTENAYGIVGMAKALEMACENMEEHRQHIEKVRAYLKNRLLEEFEDIQFNGDHEGAYLYTVLSVSFPPSPKSELLLFSLDIAGISCSGGSACSSGAEAGSHVIAAINGHPDRKTIRFSFAQHNTTAEIDFLIEKLKTLLEARKEEYSSVS
jgi:cysteine desulfurase